MEKQTTIDLGKPPFSPIIEEIYENVNELIHVTIVFKNGWEFRGVMTKEGFMKKNKSIVLCTDSQNNTLFTLTISSEEDN